MASLPRSHFLCFRAVRLGNPANLPGEQEWEQEAEGAPALRALRRAYDCEIIVLRHRMGADGANRASLAAAFHQLRTRTKRQRRARAWFASASARRDARLTRAAFGALARASRCRAAAAAAAAARRRAGFMAWMRVASLARRSRNLRLQRDRERAVKALRRWRQRVGKSGGGSGGGGGRMVGFEEERGALEWRLEVFRERRAKRVVFGAWRSAVETAAAVAAMRGGASLGMAWPSAGRTRCQGGARRGGLDRHEVTVCRGWGARLRNAEVKLYRGCRYSRIRRSNQQQHVRASCVWGAWRPLVLSENMFYGWIPCRTIDPRSHSKEIHHPRPVCHVFSRQSSCATLTSGSASAHIRFGTECRLSRAGVASRRKPALPSGGGGGRVSAIGWGRWPVSDER